MKKLYFLLIALLIAFSSFGQIIITELADPNNNALARYVEIYNPTSSAVDLTGWEIRRWTNANVDPQTTGIDLSSIGSLGAGNFAIIAASGTDFTNTYGFSPDIDGGTTGAADSNGDDQIAIFNASDTTIDIFGVPGEDGSGTCHEFEDGRAERKGGIIASKSTWDEADWNVWADSSIGGCTSHVNSPQDAPGSFDPGFWIGTSTDPNLTITIPSEGSTLPPTASTSMDVTFSVQNFAVATTGIGDGHIHYKVDGGATVMKFNTSPITLTGLAAGAHSVYMELVDDSHTPISPEVNTTVNFSIASYTQVANLAALRAGTIGNYYHVTGEVIGTFAQAYRNQKYGQDATGGILVDDDDGIITTVYNLGDGITGFKGQLSSFNDVLQIIPTEDPGAASSTGNTITPEVVTIAELATNWGIYESELVEIKTTTFVGATGSFVTGTIYAINDGTGDLDFRTSFFDADYIGTAIPTTPQNLVVLVAEYQGSPQVTAREISDMTLRVERNAIEGFSLYPNPVTNGKLTINTFSNTDKKIKIFNILGKQVLSTNLKGRELNVSKLGSGIYILKISEEGKTATRKLVIK